MRADTSGQRSRGAATSGHDAPWSSGLADAVRCRFSSRLAVAFFGLLCGLWAGGSIAYAHDTGPSSAAIEHDRTEAQSLTDRLRQVGTDGPVATSETDLVNAASRRHDLLVSLAHSAPSTVLALALDPTERAALPPAVQTYVERRADCV
jgi:hypothetical protein